jgi:hypothetical protein
VSLVREKEIAKKEAKEQTVKEMSRKARELARQLKMHAREVSDKKYAEQQARHQEWRQKLRRERAADYHVASFGQPRGTFDSLKEALRQVRVLRKAGVEVTPTRVKEGHLDTGCFHGRKFVGWETQEGKRIAKHE